MHVHRGHSWGQIRAEVKRLNTVFSGTWSFASLIVTLAQESAYSLTAVGTDIIAGVCWVSCDWNSIFSTSGISLHSNLVYGCNSNSEFRYVWAKQVIQLYCKQSQLKLTALTPCSLMSHRDIMGTNTWKCPTKKKNTAIWESPAGYGCMKK